MSPLLAIAGISLSLYFVFTNPSSGFQGYFDKPSMILLGIMPPSIMLLSHSLKDFYVGFVTLFKALFTTSRKETEVINVLTRSSQMVRSEGIGSLVKVRNQVGYDLLRDGLSLIVNDFTQEEIRHNLQNKINSKQMRMSLASNLFENMSKVSPGVGMIGTILGLIAMMINLKDPSQIGGGMALAMITTLYGLLLGTVVYAPCSEKISLEAEKSLEIDLMVLEGVTSLKAKKSSVHMKDIMSTYSNRNQPQGQKKARSR
ncbi:motility protein A [Pseudobacteriovorax antillogorgiicola]|uniref:Chemotaxis protein MotA n=1 Tax=Pseudobacteriovorax antillogorgiicola TaxID=1513793 RepID=A0A1Y6BWK4_9BACT|nr:MotA/TolQ/ExbB proton channel family protein [Pseudobacteriovorax antillogorgiicola]TCS50223.1 chemotaxis protein MotA [Pseudobacteriovorax antillogorgiicola]SMF32600.1 chemotaxis protein MotA [Pseudobacteriovorax antillogorgiicola]